MVYRKVPALIPFVLAGALATCGGPTIKKWKLHPVHLPMPVQLLRVRRLQPPVVVLLPAQLNNLTRRLAVVHQVPLHRLVPPVLHPAHTTPGLIRTAPGLRKTMTALR